MKLKDTSRGFNHQNQRFLTRKIGSCKICGTKLGFPYAIRATICNKPSCKREYARLKRKEYTTRYKAKKEMAEKKVA